MKQLRSEAGFSLVELLAVVLILSVLSAVAVPLYLNTRKDASARTCKANIAAISAAESAYALRFGKYCTDNGTALAVETAYAPETTGVPVSGGLVGAPEGLATAVKCPLGASYTCTPENTSGLQIKCNSATTHAQNTGSTKTITSGTTTTTTDDTAQWEAHLKPASADASNPL